MSHQTSFLLLLALAGAAFAAEEPGIATKYRGDAGIASDSDVIFVEDFEAGSVAAITSKWEQCQHTESMTLSNDVPEGSAGPQSLLITAIGGELWGGDLYRRFEDQEKVYVRYYVKFDKGCAGFHHGPMWIGGHTPSTSYPWPRAGDKPGDDHFSQASEPLGNDWRWDFYNYWPDMLPGGGMYWGNLFINDYSWTVERDKWICVEQMLKLNDPGDTNGEQALWIDGKEREQGGQIISRFGKGFPEGTQVGGRFHPQKGGAPFPGIRWRLRAEQKINYIWPQVFLDTAPAGVVSKVWYDHMVVAKRYIGPMQISAPKAEKASKPVAPKPAPAAPAVPKIDPQPHRDAIIAALQDPKAQKLDSVEMNLLGKKELVAIEEANSAGIKVNFSGNVIPLKWQSVESIDLITLAMAALPTDAAIVYEAGVLAAAIRADSQVQQDIINELWRLAPLKAKELKDLTQR